jgi:AbrB family looped-hinge helix DNA binding protein
MILKVTAKRQVTFPARVLEALGARPGDQIQLVESQEGYLLKPRRIKLENLATLRDLIKPGTPDFDIAVFREGTYDSSLRD